MDFCIGFLHLIANLDGRGETLDLERTVISPQEQHGDIIAARGGEQARSPLAVQKTTSDNPGNHQPALKGFFNPKHQRAIGAGFRICSGAHIGQDGICRQHHRRQKCVAISKIQGRAQPVTAGICGIGRPAHPVGQNRPLDRHTEPGHDHSLPVQRHVFGMFGHSDLRQKCLGGPTALKEMRRSLGLNHTRAALGTGVFRSHGNDHLIAGGDEVEPFRPVFTDPYHVAAAAGAGNVVRLNHPFDTCQAVWQSPRLAWHAWDRLVRISRAGRNLFLDGGNLRLRFGDRGFQIFQRQFQLGGIKLF